MGTIFINPGGPGGSGVEQAIWSEFPDELLKHYDIVGFDPRGVKHSVFSDGTVIQCSNVLDFKSYFDSEGSPANAEEENLNTKINDEYYQDCAKKNPDWWTMSTDNVVRDLEIMRQVLLKDEPLNFIGSSYGTTIASYYVAKYPEHVGKIVLDSPTSTREDLVASALENVKAQEGKINMLLDAYAADQGITRDDAFNKLMEMKQLADDDKLLGSLGIYPSKEDPTRKISPESLFQKGIMAMSYFPEADAKATFIAAMKQLVDYHDNSYFEWYALYLDGYTPNKLKDVKLTDQAIARSNEFEVMMIVNSLDYAPDEMTAAENKDFYEQAKKLAPKYIALNEDSSGYQDFEPSKDLSWKKLALADNNIPDPPKTPMPRENKSGKQLLVVGSINESVTPYKFSQETAKLLKSPLISVNDSVHAPAAYYNNACVNKILIDYFVNDKTIVDTTCNR